MRLGAWQHPQDNTDEVIKTVTAEPSSEAMLDRLVGFPTVSKDSNLSLIAFVEDHLKHLGVEATRVTSQDGRKAGLFAMIGPKVEGGVVLSGHTDVVPTEGQDWSSDPFRLRTEEQRLYGRGTTDMKAFLAIALNLIPEMQNAALKRPIHLALSYDEEIGCLGAPFLIAAMQGAIPRPAAVIVGEPTSMQVVSGHKGVIALTTTVIGKTVHSSVVHQGVSAVAYASRLAVWLDDRMRHVAGNGATDARFDPPYTTLHSGVISGGSALNITAGEATLISDIRALPGDDPHCHVDAFKAEAARLSTDMRNIDPACGIVVEIKADVPPCCREKDGAAEALARRLTGDNDEHVAAYGTEAGQFQATGWSTVVCGPGNMDQGHTPDEYIELGQIRAGEAFQRRLIAELTA